MKKNHKTVLQLTVLIICIHFSSTILGQTIWTDDGSGSSEKSGLSIYSEFLKPFRTDELTSGFSASSGTFFLTGKYTLKERLKLVADLSFTSGEYEEHEHITLSNGAEKVLGNPYLGYKLMPINSG